MSRSASMAAFLVVLSCGGGAEPARPASPAPRSAAPAEAGASVARSTTDPSLDPSGGETCGPLGPLPAPSDPVVSFREARALANAGRLLEAADLFEGAARAHPHHEIALVAADFSLDTVNRASHQRPACAARIGALAVGYSSLFGCGSPGAPEERCERFEQLRCEALRVEADWLAERDPARASETYERVHRTGCARNADQALYNAAVLARRADDPARADALIEELRRAYPESPLLPP